MIGTAVGAQRAAGGALRRPPPPASRRSSRPRDRARPAAGLWLGALRELRGDRAALLGLALLGAALAAALLADRLAPYDYAHQDLANRLAGPSFGSPHPLGTDHLGRDVLSRLLYGARVSLAVGLIATGLGVLVGVPLGSIAGYVGGKADLGITWLMDLLLAFPGLLLAIFVASVLGPGPFNAMLAIGLVNVPVFARLVRAAVLGVRMTAYVEAARAAGAPSARILARHVLPNILNVIIVRASLGLGAAILTEAGLSFIGLGAQPPDPSWGAMLNDGRAYLRREPWLATLPGLCIMSTVLAFNLLGDALRDALDPRSRRTNPPSVLSAIAHPSHTGVKSS